MTKSVCLYFSNIPDNDSTARFQHALTVAKNYDAIIFSDHPIPLEVEREAEESFMIGHLMLPERVKRVVDTCEKEDIDIIITNQYYECIASGYFSSATWISDFVDDPMQFKYNNDFRLNPRRLLTHTFPILFSNLKLGIHTAHPQTPNSFGEKREYMMNGCPEVYGDDNTNSDRKFVYVSQSYKHRDIEMIIDAMEYFMKNDMKLPKLEVYGEVDEEIQKRARDLGVDDRLKFKGFVSHSDALDAIEKADFGLCVLPDRTDFRYSSPIKVGEYMAGGTIPIISDYPGLKRMTHGCGVTTSNNYREFAETIDFMRNVCNEDISEMKRKCMDRAEEISWTIQNKKYKDILDDFIGSEDD